MKLIEHWLLVHDHDSSAVKGTCLSIPKTRGEHDGGFDRIYRGGRWIRIWIPSSGCYIPDVCLLVQVHGVEMVVQLVDKLMLRS